LAATSSESPLSEKSNVRIKEFQNRHWHAKILEASLMNPLWLSTMEALVEKNGTMNRDMQDFSSQAGFCLWRFAQYERLFEAYQSSNKSADLDVSEVFWHKEIVPAWNSVRETRFYQLREAYEKKIDEANAGLGALEYELIRLKLEASKKDRSIDYEFEVKDLVDLPLDPNKPLRSLDRFPAEDLVTVKVRTTTPEARSQVEETLRSKNLLKEVFFIEGR
jgi:hypothetical protein